MYFVYFFSTFALLNYTKNHYNYVFVFFFVFNLLLGILLLLSNAFNSLNRAAALNNIRVLCWLIATYVTNTYRVPTRLFVVGGSELKSAEGTTQSDPLAMPAYAISLQPLISLLHNHCKTMLIRRWCHWSRTPRGRQAIVGWVERGWSPPWILSQFQEVLACC